MLVTLQPQPTKKLFGAGWQYRQIVELFVQNFGDCLLGGEYYHRIMTYGNRESVSDYRKHSHWHQPLCDKWLNHPSFQDVIKLFFVGAGSPEDKADSTMQKYVTRFRDGSMETAFEEIILVIDSGGLYDQYTMDTTTESYLDIYKFFTSQQCAENKINLRSALYTKLGHIVQDYVDNIACVSLDFSKVNMILICCMILVGSGSSITAAATPWLFNSLLVMSTSATDGSMSVLSHAMSKPCGELYQLNWSMGLLQIAQSDRCDDILKSMTTDERNTYNTLVSGGKTADPQFQRLRKLSIMMMAEGVIVRGDGVVKLVTGDFSQEPTGLESFLQSAESTNGIINGKRHNLVLVWAARVYLVITLALSVYVMAGNVAGRENVFERLTDGLTCITVLWFTVFGLAKLQSDDEKIIRNVVLGHIPIQHEDELVEYLDTDAETIKVALCRTVQDYGWLSSTDCCFVKGKTKGKIEIFGGTAGAVVRSSWAARG